MPFAARPPTARRPCARGAPPRAPPEQGPLGAPRARNRHTR
ncbi:hypothetical protein GZL_06800 [Streptomyces sp. 769]|nr:hypothetical protein GZL_06800 [Streptomyces sp. 769]